MRTRFLALAGVCVLVSSLGIGCKKQGGDKQAEGDDGMKGRGMRAMEAMEGDEGMEAAEGMDSMGTMEAERPVAERPAEDPPRADAPAAEDKDAVAEGVLTEVKGTVEVRRAGKEDFEAIAKDAQVFAKDSIRVGKDGEATLALWDNSSVELPAETAITVNTSENIKEPAPSIAVMAGAARFDVNPRTEGQGPVSIYTPSAVVNVQGTTLAVGVGLSGAARVAVEAGKVDLVPVAKADGAAVEVPQ
ncbi:MAG: FecR family protein, partial [Polyangia bacterium]|nr:FecR family protein [Polyangia bacterium]